METLKQTHQTLDEIRKVKKGTWIMYARTVFASHTVMRLYMQAYELGLVELVQRRTKETGTGTLSDCAVYEYFAVKK